MNTILLIAIVYFVFTNTTKASAQSNQVTETVNQAVGEQKLIANNSIPNTPAVQIVPVSNNASFGVNIFIPRIAILASIVSMEKSTDPLSRLFYWIFYKVSRDMVLSPNIGEGILYLLYTEQLQKLFPDLFRMIKEDSDKLNKGLLTLDDVDTIYTYINNNQVALYQILSNIIPQHTEDPNKIKAMYIDLGLVYIPPVPIVPAMATGPSAISPIVPTAPNTNIPYLSPLDISKTYYMVVASDPNLQTYISTLKNSNDPLTRRVANILYYPGLDLYPNSKFMNTLIYLLKTGVLPNIANNLYVDITRAMALYNSGIFDKTHAGIINTDIYFMSTNVVKKFIE